MARIDIGGGHRIEWVFADAEHWIDPWPIEESEAFPMAMCRSLDERGRILILQGIIDQHVGQDGKDCTGSVSFALPKTPSDYARAKWEVHSLVPLHVEPSIQCLRPGCGSHGFIRGGRWEEA